MFHSAVKFYLYGLIFLSLLFAVVYLFLWVKQGRPSRPKYLLRQSLYLLVGLTCLGLFNSGVLGDYTTMIVAGLSLTACVYAAEAFEKSRSKTKAGRHYL
jgi:ABC-type transport system involved in cytochrome c biogenesis permease subunit